MTSSFPDSSSMPLLELRSPVNRFGYAYWNTKRGERRMPTRNDIDPGEIKKILPNIILLDVKQESLDFRYRLIGTDMDEHMLDRYTGKWMSEIDHQKPPSCIWTSCKWVVEMRLPLSSRIPYVGRNKEFITTEDLIMPLSQDDQTVEMLFVTVGFT